VKVFVDTNFLASAFAARGPSEDLMRHLLAEHDLVTSRDVLDELQRFLHRLRVPQATVRGILALLWEHPVMVRPQIPPAIDLDDPEDGWVLGAALLSEADVLLTGDRDLLRLKERAGIRIVDPRGFRRLARKGA